MPPEKQNQFIKDNDEHIRQVVKEYLTGNAFSIKKITDMPTDNLQVVPRGYVTLNGVVASRPKSSVATIGQSYLATDTGIPMTYSVEGWRNGVGSLVALNN